MRFIGLLVGAILLNVGAIAWVAFALWVLNALGYISLKVAAGWPF